MTILCMILLVQFFVCLGTIAKRKLGCMESVVAFVFTVLMYSLLFIIYCS